MIELGDFRVQPEVVEIFKTQAVTDVEKLLYMLELYKFVTREEILEKLLIEFPNATCRSVSTVNRDVKFAKIEREYNVLIDKKSNTKVEIIKPAYHNCRSDSLSLSLGEYDISTVLVTELNYNYLKSDDFVPEYDAGILYSRLLLEAIKLNATDLHVVTRHENKKPYYPVFYRRNGSMFPLKLFNIDRKLNEEMIFKLIEKKTKSASIDLGQSGGVSASVDDYFNNADVALRVSAMRVHDGYMCVARIQQRKTISLCIHELGFPAAVQNDLRVLSRKRSGITLVTGAIRTGKNTTAFALANDMISEPISLISYDSPIEVLMDFPQVDYLHEASRLLDLVRLAKKQDVDVAFLNEIPSSDVAFAVKDLANSSVYVITTFHLDRIWRLPYRLNEYYGDSYKDVISQINGVVNQKMFGVPCPHCAKEILVSSVEDALQRDFLVKQGIDKIRVSTGCAYCTDEVTGTTGVVVGKNQPYAEHLIFTAEIKDALLKCDHPWQMEVVLRDAVIANNATLEYYMASSIKAGQLAVDSLRDIL